MNIWVSRLVRWLLLLVAFRGAWALVMDFGHRGIPIVDRWDRMISSALNPDNPILPLDVFFRALTDHTNFLIAQPLIALAIAIGLYRLTQMPGRRAMIWAVVWCAAWAALVHYIHYLVAELKFPPKVELGLDTLPPILMVVGAGIPCWIPAVKAKNWITGILGFEILVLCVVWFLHKLSWNSGLVEANYLLLPAMLVAFGGSTYAFYRWDDAADARYIGVFWLVLLTILLVDPIATERTKAAIARPRPLSDTRKPWNERLRVIPEEHLKGNNSYPSGHTSGTFALLTPLFWWVRDRRARAGIFAWGTLQGVARVYTVAHFTSDVLMGGLLGFGVGTLVFFLLGGPSLRAPSTAEEVPA